MFSSRSGVANVLKLPWSRFAGSFDLVTLRNLRLRYGVVKLILPLLLPSCSAPSLDCCPCCAPAVSFFQHQLLNVHNELSTCSLIVDGTGHWCFFVRTISCIAATCCASVVDLHAVLCVSCCMIVLQTTAVVALLCQRLRQSLARIRA